MRMPTLVFALLAASAAFLPGQARAEGPARGDIAPLVLGEAGDKPVLLSDYRGKVVVITFWKASCAPCKEQMAAYEALNKQYMAQGLQVIGVDLGDSDREYGSLLRKVRHPTMVLAHDDGSSVAAAWGVLMLPAVWVVDAQGRVASHHDGYLGTDLPGIFEEVRGILAASQAPAPAPAPAPAQPAPAGGAPR